MIRENYALGFSIFHQDLKDGLVVKKRHKEFTEYWIYRKKATNLIGLDGRPILSQDKNNSYLFGIIVCESNHVMRKDEKLLKIEGVRFTENDINNYLRKTGRYVD